MDYPCLPLVSARRKDVGEINIFWFVISRARRDFPSFPFPMLLGNLFSETKTSASMCVRRFSFSSASSIASGTRLFHEFILKLLSLSSLLSLPCRTRHDSALETSNEKMIGIFLLLLIIFQTDEKSRGMLRWLQLNLAHDWVARHSVLSPARLSSQNRKATRGKTKARAPKPSELINQAWKAFPKMMHNWSDQ